MKIFHLNKSDINGGAARAAYRIHNAICNANIDSRMQVDDKLSDDWRIQRSNKFVSILRIRRILSRVICLLLKTKNPVIHSPALFDSGRVKEISQSNANIVHIHWVQDEMLSVIDISKIKKPIVWTLHDMWAFCGAEHYVEDTRYIEGYTSINRPIYEHGFDLNRWVWTRKCKYWKEPIHIVTPTQWLADCAKESYLMKNWPISIIPNAIDTDRWKPIDKLYARSLLILPQNKKLLLFGAMGGGSDPRKGFDLLLSALRVLKEQNDEIELVIFGQLAPEKPVDLGFKIHYMGHLHDDISLCLLYSAADIMLIPSRQDNLPNTGVESLACGTPIVAFDTCGLPDIVKHEETGYLAKSFEVDDFANGILWILENQERQKYLSQNARQFAIDSFSYPVVAAKYKELYETIVKKNE